MKQYQFSLVKIKHKYNILHNVLYMLHGEYLFSNFLLLKKTSPPQQQKEPQKKKCGTTTTLNRLRLKLYTLNGICTTSTSTINNMFCIYICIFQKLHFYMLLWRRVSVVAAVEGLHNLFFSIALSHFNFLSLA